MTSSECSTPTHIGSNTEAERLVNRLKNSQPDRFESMVKMHLSFLLDLSGSQLEDFLQPETSSPASSGGATDARVTSRLKGFSFYRKKAMKNLDGSVSSGTSEYAGVFGQPLSQQSIELIYPLIEYLHKPECLSEEGLFRKSGQALRLRALRDNVECIAQMEALEVALDAGTYSPHDAATAIKLFLRELPEPLLTTRHYTAYCQIPGMTTWTKQLHSIQLLLQLLPAPNSILLQLLLHLLHRVAYEPANLMTADTLATLFAPHMLVPRSTHACELQAESHNVTQVLAFMIDNFQVLFSPPEPLVRDIRMYWQHMEGRCAENLPVSFPIGSRGDVSRDSENDTAFDCCSCPRIKSLETADDAIHTTVCFADRAASRTDSDFTRSQVAQLYAYVSCMPDSPRKRKFIKQFNKYSHGGTVCTPENTHGRHRPCLVESIKKILTPGPRINSYEVTKECDTPRSEKSLSSSRTPVHTPSCRLRNKRRLMRTQKMNTSIDTEISVISSVSGSSDSASALSDDVAMTSQEDINTNTENSPYIAHANPCDMNEENSDEPLMKRHICQTCPTNQQLQTVCLHGDTKFIGDCRISAFQELLKETGALQCFYQDLEDKENAATIFTNVGNLKQNVTENVADIPVSPKRKPSLNNHVISKSAPVLAKPIRT